MIQTILTFISKVKPERVNDLSGFLAQIGNHPGDNPLVPFRSLKRVHFASMVLHQSPLAPEYGTYFIFENNFDGVLDDYLPDLYSLAAGGLHQIYSCCQDYSFTAAPDRQGMMDYLRAHVVRPNAYHIGSTGRSCERILQEKQLRRALEKQSDSLVQKGQATSESVVLAGLQNFVRSDPQWSWVPGVGPRETFAQKFVAWFKLIGVAVLLVGVLFSGFWYAPLFIVWAPIVVWVGVLLFKEITDSVQADAADSDNLQKLMDTENRTASVQNHMSSITIVKPGWLRRTTLRVVLWAVNLQARALATHGTLSGIPSIHFAHWSMIDNGRRLLFLSNFDGSWENYLDDFIDKASAGLSAVWSNTRNFPRTYLLVFKGATDGPRFKAVARDSQIVSNVWYSAYWDVTVQGVDNNSSIREDLLKPLDATATSAFLRRI
jgi:hypothetical protein